MSDYLARFAARIDVERMQVARVAIIGLGAVGSDVADGLRRAFVGEFVLVDGDWLEPENLLRHLLAEEQYLGLNKAEAVARWLAAAAPRTVRTIEFVPHYLTAEVPDSAIDRVLAGADVIVASTDDRRTQRRINRRALALEIPAVFPGVDATAERGEVFVSPGRGLGPCLECWESWRPEDVALRDIAALDVEVMSTVEATIIVCLGLLDPESDFSEPLRGTRIDRRPRTMFLVSRFGARPRGVFADGRTERRVVPEFDLTCPACGGRPLPRAVRPGTRQPRRPAARAGAFRSGARGPGR